MVGEKISDCFYLRGCHSVEVNDDFELTSIDFDNGRRNREEALIGGEVIHPESGRHNEKLQWVDSCGLRGVHLDRLLVAELHDAR